jgi:hypothetical protein
VTPIRERILAAHRHPPKNLTEALTEAALFGMDLDGRDAEGRSLRQLITAFREKLTTAVAEAPKRRPLAGSWGAL